MDLVIRPGTLRIVLVGVTGAGKSSTGNTMCGRRVFTTTCFGCTKETIDFDGQLLSIVDTPGLFHPNKSNEEVEREITKGLALAAPGPHVLLVVLQPGRITEQEQNGFRIIQRMFGEWAPRYTMALFTHGDELKHGKTIEEFIDRSPDLRAFVHQCGGGYHVFNNRSEHPSQVRELLEKINRMVQCNGGRYYIKDLKQRATLEYLDGFATAVAVGGAIGAITGGAIGRVAGGITGAVAAAGGAAVGSAAGVSASAEESGAAAAAAVTVAGAAAGALTIGAATGAFGATPCGAVGLCMQSVGAVVGAVAAGGAAASGYAAGDAAGVALGTALVVVAATGLAAVAGAAVAVTAGAAVGATIGVVLGDIAGAVSAGAAAVTVAAGAASLGLDARASAAARVSGSAAVVITGAAAAGAAAGAAVAVLGGPGVAAGAVLWLAYRGGRW